MDEKMAYRVKIAEKIAAKIQDEIDGLLSGVTHAKVDTFMVRGFERNLAATGRGNH